LIARVPVGPIKLFGNVGQYYYAVYTRIDLDAPGPDINTSHSRNDFLWGVGISGVVVQRLERGVVERGLALLNLLTSDSTTPVS
jgi:hypothetical protein